MIFSNFVEINPKIRLEKGESYEYVEMGDVVPGNRYVRSSQTRNYKGGGSKFENKDVLFARITPCLENGKISQFITDKKNGFGSTEFIIFRGKEGVSDQDFVYYLASSDIVRKPAEKSMFGASGRQRVDISIFDQIEISDFNLEYQKVIATLLGALDDLVEVNLRRIGVLEEVARCLYEEWFIHLRYPGHENTETTQTPHGPTPKGWNYKPIGKVVDTLGGGTPSTKEPSYWEDGNNNWYTPSDITSNNSIFITQSSRKITEKGLKSSSSKRFPAYSLMMTSRATLGELAINTTEASTNQGFITMIPTEQLPIYYLYFWVKQNLELIMNLASGATFKEINKTTFRKIPILVPGQSIIDQFNEIMNPIGALLENLIRKNRVLKETRDLLLPKLISGEIDVSDVDIQL